MPQTIAPASITDVARARAPPPSRRSIARARVAKASPHRMARPNTPATPKRLGTRARPSGGRSPPPTAWGVGSRPRRPTSTYGPSDNRPPATVQKSPARQARRGGGDDQRPVGEHGKMRCGRDERPREPDVGEQGGRGDHAS